ncbi:ThuA domain-containing protein [Gorillibacterium sp. sgz5001074]|uniref:ThuA domain-containing protein n=1 Tax=Gorillibacterium sp. sgz5001074 TaxID=3446695 RepID=UPI003F66EA35
MNDHTYRVLIVGDTGDRAPYHPVTPLLEELSGFLPDFINLNGTEEYDRLKDLSSYDLCISYTDCWNGTVSDDQAAGLIRFVEEGGPLMVLHNGISLQAHDSLFRLIGARFTGHPPYQTLNFHPAANGSHPITEAGLPSFAMEEEPYQFAFAPDSQIQLLMEYEWEGQRVPAAWYRRQGEGHVVYLMPGHHRPSFTQPEYVQWIMTSMDWLLQQAPGRI